MEVPEPIRKQVEKKGGMKGIILTLPDKSSIENEALMHKVLSNPLRIRILNLVSKQSLCVCLIKQAIDISDSKLSYHLSILEEAGLIVGTKKQNWIIYEVTHFGKEHAL